jgi:hypothetical protein
LVSIPSFTQAQTDTVKADKVYMLDGSTIDGKVKTVKSDIVVFTEKETCVDYELNKSDIKVIILASGKPMVFTTTTAPVEKQVTQSAVVMTAPETRSGTTETPPVKQVSEIQFSLAGYLAGSLQNWNDLQTDKSKLGFGLSGDLLAGIIWEEMYFGVGPHFGGSWWTLSESIVGYDVSITTAVADFGIDFAAAWDGFFCTVGRGSGNVGITTSVGGESDTYEYPEGIGYTRIVIGFYDGYMLGLGFMSYDDEIQNNLNRVEIMIGWAF